MQKINVLDFEIANLIAAGEVVERPSSVLKELIENSIDAGASRIVAEIKRGGVALIRVSDDGCGIDKDDLPIALKRHATSKIKDKSDLEEIMSLGFRGEALAAISSVSNVTIITKTKEAEIGYMLTAEAGKVTDMSEVGCADGTTVVVSDLFYNVPARRKFLKKDSTEAMNVTALVEKVALSRPDISIQLLIDGVEKFKTPGNGRTIDTIYAVLGKDFASKLIEVKGVDSGVEVSGYIGRSDNVRKNRNLMNVFLNGRYVKSLTAQAAIERAFTSYIAPECFPTCVLYIKMNPSMVDVNVHPAKLEVKFSDERCVFEAVYFAVRSALEKEEYRPEMELKRVKSRESAIGAFVPIGEDTRGTQLSISAPPYIREGNGDKAGRSDPSTIQTRGYADEPHVSVPRGYNDSRERPLRLGSYTTREETSSGMMTPKDSVELLRRYRSAEGEPILDIPSVPAKELPPIRVEEDGLSEDIPTVSDYRFIDEAFDCYVMVEYDGALLVIDKHAAHERVLFEQLKHNMEEQGSVQRQPLLIPLDVTLGHEQTAILEDLREELLEVGFEFNLENERCRITSIPYDISSVDAESLFQRMVDEIVEGRGNPTLTDSLRREKALYQIACKAAIKGGRVYDRAILDWLIGRLLALPDITVCPHGRPVAYRLTKRELDRQFDRIK